jgi:hypothetical protein
MCTVNYHLYKLFKRSYVLGSYKYCSSEIYKAGLGRPNAHLILTTQILLLPKHYNKLHSSKKQLELRNDLEKQQKEKFCLYVFRFA